MKKNSGPKKISVKVNSRDGGIYRALSESMSGSKKMIIDPGLSAYQLPDGTTLELYQEGAVYPDYLFSFSDLVVNYKVDHLGNALAALEQEGARLMGKVEKVSSTYSYCHVKISERQIIGIFQED